MNLFQLTAAGFICCAIAGCQPAESPSDLIKPQRDALNKAKAVEGLLQQQAEIQKKAADEVQK